MFYEKRPEACNIIKKETLGEVFSCEFCEISKNTFLTEHLWTTASVLYGVYPTATLQKHLLLEIDCDKHYRLSKHFIKFPRTSSGTAKAIATFKETTNCKIPQAVSAIWAPGTDFS